MGEISNEVTNQIRVVALDWARTHGERSPRVSVVATTHREALAYLHDDEEATHTYLAVTELATPVYLLVLEGNFSYEESPRSVITGSWAAFVLTQQELGFRGQTIRPAAYIPDMDLRQLGEVHEL